jgi:hypothetical protein
MDAIPPGEAITMEPLDRILWWHIGLMTLCFGILYPIGMLQTSFCMLLDSVKCGLLTPDLWGVGMVLGIVKSRYHVPLQLATTLVVITAVYVSATYLLLESWLGFTYLNSGFILNLSMD